MKYLINYNTGAAKAWQEGIDRGITDGTRPKDNITREEAITMILRAIKE